MEIWHHKGASLSGKSKYIYPPLCYKGAIPYFLQSDNTCLHPNLILLLWVFFLASMITKAQTNFAPCMKTTQVYKAIIKVLVQINLFHFELKAVYK